MCSSASFRKETLPRKGWWNKFHPRQGHATLRAAFLLSTAAQHPSGCSSSRSNTSCTYKFDCHSSGLWTTRGLVFLMQFINFLFYRRPHALTGFFGCFISHHPSTQLPHLCSLPSPGPSHSYQFPFLSHHQYSYTSPLPSPGFHCLLDPSFNHLSYHRDVQLELTFFLLEMYLLTVNSCYSFFSTDFSHRGSWV